ncbi:MAG: hypothetical protein IMF18_05010, partial [Proteobacteria bacterium]|nr:hypothetical protein [Pseudomonadota bacterium]
ATDPKVEIWDNDTTDWITTFANGDPIDTGTGNAALHPQLAIDRQDRVYVTYYQSFTGHNHIYLSRYDGTDVRIWDNDTTDWITTFANGDPIDTGTDNSAYNPQVVVDSNHIVYVTYYQSFTGKNHIYLSGYVDDPQSPSQPLPPSGGGGGGGCFVGTVVDGLGW